MPSTAANSSVTHSTPAASSPSTERRSSAKWKSTKVETLNSSIAGTASPVRSSTRRSLRTSAPTARLTAVPLPIAPRLTSARRRGLSAGAGRRAARARGRPRRAPARRRGRSARAWRRSRARSAARPAPAAPGSRLASGSSSSSSSGSCSSARQIATRCAIPRDSERTGSSARRAIPTASSSSSARRRHVVQPRVEAQVLARGQVAVEQRLVGEQPDPPAHRPALARQRAPEHARLAGVRAQQRGEHPQQRRLAGAVGAEHRQRGARAAASSVTPASATRSPYARARSRSATAGAPSAVVGHGATSRRAASAPRARASARARRTSWSIAFGEPGKLTISVRPAMPETPRVRIPIGVCRAPSARIASAKPGASRSITARVASGVTSSGVSPVPPVVKIRSQPLVDVVVQPVLDQREVVGHDLHRDHLAAGLLGRRGQPRPGEVLRLPARDRRRDR